MIIFAQALGWRMTGSVVKCSKRHERSGRCVRIASVPEVLYKEGGLEGEGGHIGSGIGIIVGTAWCRFRRNLRMKNKAVTRTVCCSLGCD